MRLVGIFLKAVGLPAALLLAGCSLMPKPSLPGSAFAHAVRTHHDGVTLTLSQPKQIDEIVVRRVKARYVPGKTPGGYHESISTIEPREELHLVPVRPGDVVTSLTIRLVRIDENQFQIRPDSTMTHLTEGEFYRVDILPWVPSAATFVFWRGQCRGIGEEIRRQFYRSGRQEYVLNLSELGRRTPRRPKPTPETGAKPQPPAESADDAKKE